MTTASPSSHSNITMRPFIFVHRRPSPWRGYILRCTRQARHLCPIGTPVYSTLVSSQIVQTPAQCLPDWLSQRWFLPSCSAVHDPYLHPSRCAEHTQGGTGYGEGAGEWSRRFLLTVEIKKDN